MPPDANNDMATSFFKFRYADDHQVPRAVKLWLLTGLAMIFMQIVIGGVTRLTGSGLSITRWEIVTGAVPPLSEADWQEAFDLYKQTPQYQKINEGMDIGAFKFIYFWEYFHRLWARLMFFVFVFPFAWFLWRGMMARRLVPRLLVVVALAGLEGFFGWAMVASGLIKRPWVNAYNLTLHLCMALVIFAYLMWTAFIAYRPQGAVWREKKVQQMGLGHFWSGVFSNCLGRDDVGRKSWAVFPHLARHERGIPALSALGRLALAHGKFFGVRFQPVHACHDPVFAPKHGLFAHGPHPLFCVGDGQGERARQAPPCRQMAGGGGAVAGALGHFDDRPLQRRYPG
jgi:Uncharacterized protein required for cytochrome oxidase assembly